MTWRKPLILIAAIIVLVGICVACFFYGQNYALGKITTSYATPDQIAQAMNDDDFYSSYRESMLIVSGKVAGVTQQDSQTVIQLETNTAYQAYCDTESTSSIKVGDAVRVLAQGFQAERLPHAVQLDNCQIL